MRRHSGHPGGGIALRASFRVGQGRSRASGRRLRIGMALLAALALACIPAWPTRAQDPQRREAPPIFPGRTIIGDRIRAQAAMMEAYGDMMESLATARQINARAVADELQNWVTYVEDYFKRRQINREETAKLLKNRPDVIRDLREKAMKDLMSRGFQEVLRGSDHSPELNWLLNELCGPTLAVQYLVASESLPELQEKLSEDAKKHIWITDGGPRGRRLEFTLADGKPLATAWPPGLLREEFDPLRAEFEAARDQLLAERQGGSKVSAATRNRLYSAVDDLMIGLEKVYPEEARRTPATFLEYNAAKYYVRSLMAQVQRAVGTNDPSVFAGSKRFQANTLGELIQHMYQSGLMFAPAKEGEEGYYRHLLESMRNLYVKLLAERPAVQGGQPRP